jgi:hypothetical protein
MSPSPSDREPGETPRGDSIDQLNEGQLVLVGAGTITAILGLVLGLLLLLGALVRPDEPIPGDKLSGALAFPLVACVLVLVATIASRSPSLRRAARKDGIPAYLMAVAAALMILIAWLVSG